MEFRTLIINNITTPQLTCFVASDSCCSILSTTFLKGGLLKGSASQQDLIIWYLHRRMQTHKHFYLPAVATPCFCFLLSRVQRKSFSISDLVMPAWSQMQQNESRLPFKSPTLHSSYSHHLGVSNHTDLFASSYAHTHISLQHLLQALIFQLDTTYISLGANSGASILYPSFISL